jgi:hypothetical protein
MIADGLAKRTDVTVLTDAARIEVWNRRDGVWSAVLMVRGGTPARWRQKHFVETGSHMGALLAAYDIGTAWHARRCVCGHAIERHYGAEVAGSSFCFDCGRGVCDEYRGGK